ncbi:amino acid adenylation domain-containing protein [Aquimarina sp. MAR_2010_214]|uniref:non-ribosomal peptide synthetase n=1 Tax=Aquimarina sp. MAR_2010_214 TaxID=1250026 RepID=UPI000C708192|nr:non-ribosomal peptide synthetase [Aquimarina sp. MAR_2010_214]PKV49525.1 amino acid adenylation domain-containing protein [Aquimarina sp. MAR_2010_214]
MRTLLKELRDNNIFITLQGDNLKLKFEQKVFPPSLLEKIKTNKATIVGYLKEHQGIETSLFDIEPLTVSNTSGHQLSSSQMRMWVLSQFEDASLAYHLPNIVTLKGNYDIALLKKAVMSVIDRHEILRTVFKESDSGEPYQWILGREELDFDIDCIDLRKEKAVDQYIQNYILEDNAQSFDLHHGPLLRVSLFQISESDYTIYYNMHHIISDGWSMGILAKDVLHFYHSYVNEKETDITPLRIQYKDYAAWQQKRLLTAESGQDRQFWLEQLSGELPTLQISSGKQRPEVKTYNGRTLKSYLDEGEVEILKTFTAKQEGSLFITLLALWNVLLYRYCSQKDIIIGSPVAGRDHIDLEQQIGFYVNTLVFRNVLSSELSFEEFYHQVKQRTLEVYQHQSYPFDLLVDELELRRDTSRNAVFDVMLVLQNTEKHREATILQPGETEKISVLGESYAKFDLEILFEEDGDHFSFKVDYNTDVFEQETVIGLMRHFKQLLSNTLKEPSQSIGGINILSQKEIDQIILEFNRPINPKPVEKTIIDLFQTQVQQVPEQVALVVEDKKISYQELDKISNRLAIYLHHTYHLTENELIGVMLPRSEWLVISLLAIMKCGAAYVPIDLGYPESRKNYIKEDAACRLVVDEYLISDFQMNSITNEKDIILCPPQPTDLAYVIYTSGSTGNPKGVMLSHSSVVSFLQNIDAQLGFSKQKVVAATTNITFDISVLELFGPLVHGKQIVLFVEEDLLEPVRFLKRLEQAGVEVLQLTPSRLQQVADRLLKTPLPSLQRLIVGGEAFPKEYYEQFKQVGAIPVVNVYGPTETTIWSTALDISTSKQLSVGKPLQNEQVLILNKQGTLQPLGVIGEICIGGQGLAKGYWNRPELTKEKFINHPYEKEQKLYRTGDLGKWLPDGNILCLGREDDQVKVRGHRIELGEIEYHLQSKDNIQKAVVMVSNSQTVEKELVAYLVSASELNSSDLRTYLSSIVPDYMIPEHYVQLEDIPLMVSGKVNKRALPDPKGIGLSTGTTYIAPRNEVEERLVQILNEMLEKKKDEISVSDNFFDLGANSVKLIKILNTINKEFDMDLKPIMLFQYPNINDLVENVFYFKKQVNEDNEDLSQDLEDIIDLMEG